MVRYTEKNHKHDWVNWSSMKRQCIKCNRYQFKEGNQWVFMDWKHGGLAE